MLVKKTNEPEKREIDLTSPDGNAFFLMGTARRWMNQIDPSSTEKLLDRMKSGDYANLVAIFEISFGMLVELKMDEKLLDQVSKRIKALENTNFVTWDLEDLGFDLN